MGEAAVFFTSIDSIRDKEEFLSFRHPIVVSRGKVHRIHTLPGFAAMEGDSIKGLLTYQIHGNACEIVSLDSKEENQGIGTALIHLVIDCARERKCQRVWLVTTNENIRAIRFYQKRGFDMKRIHRFAVDEARKLKPSIPLYSEDGIPIRHEIEFEMRLGDADQ